MTNIPISIDGKGEKNGNHDNLDNWAEGFEVLKTFLLYDTLSNKSSLVVVDGTVEMSLKMVHPLATK